MCRPTRLIYLNACLLALALVCEAPAAAPPASRPAPVVGEVARLVLRQPAGKDTPAAKEVEALWKGLGDSDAAKAYKALHALVKRPAETVALLKVRLRSVPPADPKKIERLVVDLASKQEAVWKKAAQELEQLEELAHPALRKAFTPQLPREVRDRIQKLLQRAGGPVVEPERLRALRGLEALEVIGSAEAQAVLQALADGARGHRLTEEARAAVKRLRARSDLAP